MTEPTNAFVQKRPGALEAVLCAIEEAPAAEDDWDDFKPGPRQNNIWDAFDLDDERDEPLPEYGDFWPEPDEDEV